MRPGEGAANFLIDVIVKMRPIEAIREREKRGYYKGFSMELKKQYLKAAGRI